MAAATFDVKKQVNQGRSQATRRVELHYQINFATLGDGTGLDATQDAEFAVLPDGYVHERLDAVLRTAEGEAATVHVGTEADADLFGVSLNVNGTPNAQVGIGAPAAGAGYYVHAATPVRVTCPAAANTVNAAKLDLTFVGYMRETA